MFAMARSEDEKLEECFHATLAANLMTVAFSLESVRARLAVEGHPAEAELGQIGNRISEILTLVARGDSKRER